MRFLSDIFSRMSPAGAILASIAAILVGPRALSLLLDQVPERYAPSAGILLPLIALSVVAAFFGVTYAYFALRWGWGRLQQTWLARFGGGRAIARIGDREMDAWIDEGLAAYGSINRSAAAGIVAGLLLPWLTVVLGGYLYNLVTGWYADSYLVSLRGSVEETLSWSAVGLNLFLGAYGGIFALVKRAALRRRLANPYSRIAWLTHPHVAGTLVGVLFFLLLGALPQSADSREVIVVIIVVAPIWGALGFAVNLYFHWFHARLLRLLYLKDWAGAVRATAERLVIGNLEVTSPCAIRVDGKAGRVTVDHFPAGKGASRLEELIRRIPGVEGVDVYEQGRAAPASRSSILTVYTGLGDSTKPVQVLRTASWLPLAGGALGAAVYLVGTALMLLRGLFGGGLAATVSQGLWADQAQLLKQGVLTGAVGWAAGFVVHRFVRYRVQRRLPGELKEALAGIGVALEEFRPGDSDSDIHVTANLTRQQAIDHLGPVAGRFGVKRILLTTALPDQVLDQEPAEGASRPG